MMARDKRLSFANAKQCFLPKMDTYVAKKIGLTEIEFSTELDNYKRLIVYRGKVEIQYWNNYVDIIKEYTRERAIEELLKAKKLQEKISMINSYIEKLCK